MLAGEKECCGVEVGDWEGLADAEGRWNWVVIVGLFSGVDRCMRALRIIGRFLVVWMPCLADFEW